MRVVLADDSIRIRQVWRSMLINLGHEVVGEGIDGFQAVSLCDQMRPDIAILDFSMGDYGGDVAAQRIREAGTANHILLCTSRSSIKEEFEEKGFHVLVKPVMEKNLGNKIVAITKG